MKFREMHQILRTYIEEPGTNRPITRFIFELYDEDTLQHDTCEQCGTYIS